MDWQLVVGAAAILVGVGCLGLWLTQLRTERRARVILDRVDAELPALEKRVDDLLRRHNG